MARSVKLGTGAPVYVADRPGRREPAEVVSDSGIGPIEVRLVGSGALEQHDFRDLQVRRLPPSPPPGAGGRDLPPLRFGSAAEPGPDYVHPRRQSPAEQQIQMAAEARPRVMAQLREQPKPMPPYRDEEYLAFVRALPCTGCGVAPPSDPHHFGPRGVGQKGDDDLVVPLCRRCHDRLHAGQGLPGLHPSALPDVLERAGAQLVRRHRRVLVAELARTKRQVAALLARAAPAGGG